MNTKIFASMVLALVLIPVFSNAQVSFTLKQGVTASTLSEIGDLGDNNNISLSYTIGGFAIIPLNGKLSFQPEVNYNRKGRFEKSTISGITQRASQSYDFIQVPLLLRVTPANMLTNSNAKVFFNGGVYEGFVLKSQALVKANDAIVGTDITDKTKNNDFGVVFGGGVEFPFRSMMLQFDLRYDMGLTKITNQSDNFQTKALSLTMGVRF